MSLSDAVLRFTRAVKAKLTVPLGTQGQILTRRNGVVTAAPLVREIGIVESDTALALQQGTTESFAAVFNSWLRISRIAGASYPTRTDTAVPSELNAWTYNEATNSVVCTVNSVSLIGFISPQQYDDYVLEVMVNSTNSDDDFIGVCIAHATNAEGQTEVLTALRGLNGRAPLVIDKNRNAFDASEYTVATVFNGLKWANGAEATGAAAPGLGGWSTLTTGAKLKVTRQGDLITVETTQLDETEYFAPARTVIDLSADPELAVFRGPQRYGYVCYSQPNSTWAVLQRPGSKLPIIDQRTMELWTYNGGSWTATVKTPEALTDEGYLIPYGLHRSPGSDQYFYVTGSNDIVRL